MTEQDLIQYGEEWDKSLAERGDSESSTARIFLSAATRALRRIHVMSTKELEQYLLDEDLVVVKRKALKALLESEPCEDVISRKQCIDTVNKILAPYIPKLMQFTLPLDLVRAINELPLVTSQSKTGHWEDCSNGWMCSNCYRDVSYESDFCPHCGADMRGDRECTK